MDLVEIGIEPFAHGVVGIEKQAGGVRLNRMSRTLLEYYGRHENWAVRARCNAGVSICFATDSPTVDLELEILEGPRRYYGVDAEVDGVQTFGTRLDDAEGSLSVRVAEGGDGSPRPIRIYLGPCMEVRARSVRLEDGAVVEPVPKPPFRLLALGDSITQGMEARSPSSAYPTRLARLIEADLTNQAVGGHVFDPEAIDMESSIDPGLVTVAYGTNDWGGGVGEAIGDTVRAYLERLRASLPDPPIVVLSPVWRTDATERRGGLTLREFSNRILEAAEETDGVIPIDGIRMVPHQAYYFEDGVHPNDTGFLHYAMKFYRALRDTGTLAAS